MVGEGRGRRIKQVPKSLREEPGKSKKGAVDDRVPQVSEAEGGGNGEEHDLGHERVAAGQLPIHALSKCEYPS